VKKSFIHRDLETMHIRVSDIQEDGL